MSGSITFLLTVFALIPGIPAGYQCPIYCSETTFCCPGYYCIAEECHESNSCSQPGQTVLQVGNATQDNRCWCDITRGYAPGRPKLCMQTNDPSDCHCERCPNGTTPHIKDEFGNWKLYFMPKNDCKINCETHLENTQRELRDLNGTFQNVSRERDELSRDRDAWKTGTIIAFVIIGIESMAIILGILLSVYCHKRIVDCCKRKCPCCEEKKPEQVQNEIEDGDEKTPMNRDKVVKKEKRTDEE